MGSFIYASTEAFSLTVEGGYTSSCSSRVVDPTNTVLDASGLETVLVLTTTQSVDFAVDGITLRNGLTAYSDHGGGSEC